MDVTYYQIDIRTEVEPVLRIDGSDGVVGRCGIVGLSKDYFYSATGGLIAAGVTTDDILALTDETFWGFGYHKVKELLNDNEFVLWNPVEDSQSALNFEIKNGCQFQLDASIEWPYTPSVSARQIVSESQSGKIRSVKLAQPVNINSIEFQNMLWAEHRKFKTFIANVVELGYQNFYFQDPVGLSKLVKCMNAELSIENDFEQVFGNSITLREIR